MSESRRETERTRRQLLEGAAGLAAAGALAHPALTSAAADPAAAAAGLPAPSGDSPLPVGPGAPYGTYQSEIYIAGMSTGTTPIFTTNLSDLEELAGRNLSDAAQAHLLAEAGGAEAARKNARSLRRWRIVPRMLIDRSGRDLSTEVAGAVLPAPVILGPIGDQELAHPDGESATASAAAALGLTYVHSARASRSIEQVTVSAPSGPRWFGLDWPATQSPDLGSLRRAQTAGCTHLVLTPPQPRQGWGALGAVRNAWDGPILLSGVQSPAAARMAVRRGFAGIVVSNEFGRRGAKPRGTINRLPEIVDAVGKKIPVLFGSGVITGTDAYRALALGARAVVIGRPYVHGLALGGTDGVQHMLRTLLAELETNLAIAGVRNHTALTPKALVRQ